MTKPTMWPVHPAKTHISRGIRPVWSESLLCAQWVAEETMILHVDREDWSDWADAQADLNSKKISNDQELIQSDPTSCPQNQKGNN